MKKELTKDDKLTRFVIGVTIISCLIMIALGIAVICTQSIIVLTMLMTVYFVTIGILLVCLVIAVKDYSEKN